MSVCLWWGEVGRWLRGRVTQWRAPNLTLVGSSNINDRGLFPFCSNHLLVSEKRENLLLVPHDHSYSWTCTGHRSQQRGGVIESERMHESDYFGKPNSEWLIRSQKEMPDRIVAVPCDRLEIFMDVELPFPATNVQTTLFQHRTSLLTKQLW